MGSEQYFDNLVAAFVRGRLADDPAVRDEPALFAAPLHALTEPQVERLVALGQACGLRLHKFKRTMGLPRVGKALGVLKGLQPANLLDIGSGRGAFLWPLLDTFPALPVTAVDLLDWRVDDLLAVRRGGVERLAAGKGDATSLPFADRSFDVVTLLEVLEHIPATGSALDEVCRVARRALIISAPTRADDNPEHIHLFDQATLRRLLGERGVTRVTCDYVPNHMILVAMLPANDRDL